MDLLPVAIVPALCILILVLYLLFSAVKILREYERAVIFRLGRLAKAPLNPGGTGNGPGLVVLLPVLDKMVKVSLRTVALNVPSQDVITKDNVSLKVDAVIYFRVLDPERALVAVEDYLFATSQIAQTTLRSVLGQSHLDELLSERDRINQRLQRIVDEHTDPWGIKVSAVEVKRIDLPPDMQRVMAKQAEAEREKRAKIIHAEGELLASEKLAQAARVIASEPTTIQLRYLKTLSELGTEQESTVLFPLPMDILPPSGPEKSPRET
jgi:regulator of protease activity HflC (stomatin/prohibitin superfamily)